MSWSSACCRSTDSAQVGQSTGGLYCSRLTMTLHHVPSPILLDSSHCLVQSSIPLIYEIKWTRDKQYSVMVLNVSKAHTLKLPKNILFFQMNKIDELAVGRLQQIH